MANGAALPRRIDVNLHSSVAGYSGFYSARVDKDGVFSTKVAAGQIWAEANIEGHAPAVIGPFDGTTTNLIEIGELVVSKGFEVTLQFKDAESGRPVGNAGVKTAFILSGCGHHLQNSHSVTSDVSGRVILPRCVDQPLHLTVNAAGYEITQRKFDQLKAGDVLEVSLRPGVAVTGRVVDEKTGAGISGATLRIIHESGEAEHHYNWTDAMRVLGKTTGDGGFSITQLRAGVRYWLGLSAPGHASTIVPARAGARLEVKLGPELIVRGRVIGSLDALQRISDRPVMYASMSEEIESSSHGDGEWLPVHAVEGGGTFIFTNRVAGPVTLTGGGYRERRRVTEPIGDWIIDLASRTNSEARSVAENLPSREVVFRFVSSSGVKPTGTARVVVPEDLNPESRTSVRKDLVITNGEVRVNIAIGGYTSLEPGHMPGFWFNSSGTPNLWHCQVTAGEGPMILEVPVIAAGAIYATARNQDGSPAGGLFFGIHELKRAPNRGDHGSVGHNGDSVSGDAPRRWVSGPLPLGGTYEVYGWRGNTFCISKPIALTESAPDAEVVLQFGDTTVLQAIVSGPSGEPVRDVRLEAGFSLRSGHGFGLKPLITDQRGQFRIENATPDIGQYTVLVAVPGMMAERVKLDSTVHAVRLRPGRKLAGRIVEKATGHILPNVEVRAVDLDLLKLPEQKVRTNADGYFEFTTLGDANYTLYINGAQVVGSRKFRSGQTNLTVEVKSYREASTAKR